VEAKRKIKIDAGNLNYRELNEKIRELVQEGCQELTLKNICGHRYICTGIKKNGLKIKIDGTPGNNLGAFMDGPEIEVKGNVQEGTGNTMNAGKIVVHGSAGDIPGHSMRGGEIYIRNNAGYRTGIHIKEYGNSFPVIVVGGETKDFLGEYMAGGMIIVLGLKNSENITGYFTGTGMHAGVIYVRGKVNQHQSGQGIKIFKTGQRDFEKIKPYIEKFAGYFDLDCREIMQGSFVKLLPVSHRPYGKLYAY
jgi:glutamate synthase domain-containing protein 3